MNYRTIIFSTAIILIFSASAIFACDESRRSPLPTSVVDENGDAVYTEGAPDSPIEEIFALGENDQIVTGDFDGDCKPDKAVWQGETGTWFILSSSTGELDTIKFGMKGDQPAPDDFDEDGRTDIAVWRERDRLYYVLRSSDGKLQAFKKAK